MSPSPLVGFDIAPSAMIPAGYASALIAWATLPSLSAATIAARKATLLAEFEALVTGHITGTGKTSQAMLSASANGKSFTFDSALTKADKLVVLGQVLRALGLTDTDSAQPTVTYPDFTDLRR